MKREAFFQNVKKGAFERVYFFYGPEEYVKASALKALREAILPEGLEMVNEAVLANPSLEDLDAAAQTMPFMAERRLVVVNDLAALRQSKGEGEGVEAATGDGKALLEWCAHAPDTACVVIYHTGKLDERRGLAKGLIALPGSVRFDYLVGEELRKWIDQAAERQGKRFAKTALNEFTAGAGEDLASILGALEQVCAYVGENPEIDLEAVRAIVQPPLDAKVFAMIDDIMAGNMARAQIAAKTLVDEGESRVGILALIIRQLRLMTDIRLLQDARKTAPEIAQALKLSDFVYRKTAGSVRSLAAPEILAAYQRCVDADFQFKSGQIGEQAALDRAIFTLHALFAHGRKEGKGRAR